MCCRFSNLVEVRTIPGKSDIAFVEFTDIPSSAAARERLNGHAFPDGTKLKVGGTLILAVDATGGGADCAFSISVCVCVCVCR